MSEQVSAWRLVLLAAGFLIWSLAFVVLYASLSIGCSFGWQGMDFIGDFSIQRVQLVILFALHFAAGLGLMVVLKRQARQLQAQEVGRFVGSVAYYTALVAVASTGFTFMGVFFLSPCL